MSDLDAIINEIDEIMMESDKEIVYEAEPEDGMPSMEEISATVAGVVMEEFPAGGGASAFGHALVEASIGAADDIDANPASVLAGVITFFEEAIQSAVKLSESYDESGEVFNEEEEDDDEDDPSDDYEEEDDEDEVQEENFYSEGYLESLYED